MSAAMSDARPIIKWVGGKTSVLPELLPLFPAKIKTYYEPFIGGAALFFALKAEGRFEKAVINDWNDELVNLYRTISANPKDLTDTLQKCKAEYTENGKETFHRWRARQPHSLTEVERAARTIFLTKTSFNGLYRLNKKGEFNAPWGKYENPLICDEPNILACHKALQDVTFHQGDFAKAVLNAGPGDVVYFDPPYFKLSDTADFASYTAEGFTLEDHKRLRDTFVALVQRGVTCILSNHDVPIMHEMFADYEIRPIQVRRSINSKADKRGGVGEVIVVGRPDPSVIPSTYQFERTTSAAVDWDSDNPFLLEQA